MEYVEQNCTITHEGRSFTSGGAIVTDTHITAYLAKDGVLTDWHGNRIGSYRITSSWATPRSFVSSRMYQVRAFIGGRAYTGRSAGVGVVFNGKACKVRVREDYSALLQEQARIHAGGVK